MFVSYMTQAEKEEKVGQLIDDITSARDGETFDYRGLKIERMVEQSRNEVKAVVRGQEGQRISQIDLAAHRRVEIVEALEEMRQSVAEQW